MLMRRARRRDETPAPGIRRHGAGWQAMVKVRGERAYQQFDVTTPLSEIIDWQKDERARLRVMLPTTKAGTFAGDAKKYLARADVQKLPTYSERVQHLGEWVKVFGPRRRRSITPADIEAQRDRWLTESRGARADGTTLPPYSSASVNKRLRALSNLWTKMDGRRAPNPVADVAECEEPDPEARGLPYDIIDAILNEMPEHAIGVKKDGSRTTGKPRINQAKVICTIYAYAGLAPEQLKVVDRSDVDFEARTLRQTARRKGRKLHRAQDRARPDVVPLLPQALEAFRQFDALKLWRRRYSNSTVTRGFQKACRRLALKGLRVYDLRHSFLSLVYAETHDLRVTGTFGGHRSERTTKRYTVAAVAPHVQAAADKVRARLATMLATSVANADENRRKSADANAGAEAPESADNRCK